jgi:hypothetical protein
MISRRFDRWQKVAALAPALLLLVVLPAQVMFRCRMDGLLRSERCCAHGDQDDLSPGPAMKGQDCCAQEVAEVQRPKADQARSETHELAAATVLAVVFHDVLLVPPALPRFDRVVERYGPGPNGPPLVLLKHAFLI